MTSKSIHVIAPSLYTDIKSIEVQRAKKRLEAIGYSISFCEGLLNGTPEPLSNSLAVDVRIKDLHDAYINQEASIIMPIIGGYNANQLLPYIDFNLINNNPKIFCGYSDITILTNAIYAKTGVTSFSGPNFKNFGVTNEAVFDFNYNEFIKAISGAEGKISSSTEWTDNVNMYQKEAEFWENQGPVEIQSGNFSGTLVGGNLCSFNLLQGTEFMPNIKETVIFLEDDLIFTNTNTFLLEFERNLISLSQQPNFNSVQGLLIGRFEKRSGIEIAMLSQIIKANSALKHLPIIANFDFGHTSPALTFPIGKKAHYLNGKLFF